MVKIAAKKTKMLALLSAILTTFVALLKGTAIMRSEFSSEWINNVRLSIKVRWYCQVIW
jgi:hypothetical protein